MKIVTPVADGSGTVTLPVLDADPIVPMHVIDGVPWTCHPSAHFLGPRMLEVEREFREIRLPLARRYGVENGLNRVTVDPTDAWIGLVATGFTYYELLDALRRLGLRHRAGDRRRRDPACCSCACPCRSIPDLVRTFARGLDEIVVVEEKNPTLEWLVKDALYGGPNQPRGARQDPRGRPHADEVVGPPRRRRHARRAARAARRRASPTGWRPTSRRRRRRSVIPVASRPHAVLLLRLPAQLGHEGARRGARRGRHRLPRHDAADGRGAGRRDASASRRWATRAPSGSAWSRSSAPTTCSTTTATARTSTPASSPSSTASAPAST